MQADMDVGKGNDKAPSFIITCLVTHNVVY